jgi:hypothetical protein
MNSEGFLSQIPLPAVSPVINAEIVVFGFK